MPRISSYKSIHYFCYFVLVVYMCTRSPRDIKNKCGNRASKQKKLQTGVKELQLCEARTTAGFQSRTEVVAIHSVMIHPFSVTLNPIDVRTRFFCSIKPPERRGCYIFTKYISIPRSTHHCVRPDASLRQKCSRSYIIPHMTTSYVSLRRIRRNDSFRE